MVNKKLLDGLNKAIAMDLRATVQYMWQHVMALGMESPEVKDILKDISIEEMKHVESFAERLYYLGGTPTTKPLSIKVGGSLNEMLENDLTAEKESIELCKDIIKMAIEENDPGTRLLVEKILAETEEHAHMFRIILGR